MITCLSTIQGQHIYLHETVLYEGDDVSFVHDYIEPKLPNGGYYLIDGRLMSIGIIGNVITFNEPTKLEDYQEFTSAVISNLRSHGRFYKDEDLESWVFKKTSSIPEDFAKQLRDTIFNACKDLVDK